MKAKSFCEGFHGLILLQDIGDDAVQFLVSRDLDEPAQQFGAQAAMLIGVAHEHGDFSLVPAVQFAQTPNRNDPILSRVCVSVVGHQGHLPVVVDEAHADETLVRDARSQAEEVEVSQVGALLGERLVELHHQGLVLGADGAKGHGRAIFHRPRRDVFRRIRPNGQPGKLVCSQIPYVQHDPGVQRNQAFGRSKQWINVDLFDPALFRSNGTEP